MAHHFFIQGPLGAGKTFIMSLLAHHWRERVRKLGGDLVLFSNYNLLDSQPIDTYEDWYKVAEAQGSISCWDECHRAFSNRSWGKFGQTVATDVLTYTRKMKSVTFYCSPSINNVDSRIRQIVEVLINVRKIGNAGFSLHFTDYQTGEFMHKQFIPMSKAKKVFKLKLYDTDEMVKGFPVPKTEREAEVFFNKLEEIHDRARGKIVI